MKSETYGMPFIEQTQPAAVSDLGRQHAAVCNPRAFLVSISVTAIRPPWRLFAMNGES